uniref:Uncharacterized protein n=1 Tax=Picea glauca TaxID=3330 RepID=A0A101LVU1_PICGL|nr:hypothetical protein ABT39_MTgene1815 [Picea glauca]
MDFISFDRRGSEGAFRFSYPKIAIFSLDCGSWKKVQISHSLNWKED